jgi:hypothetical protein
MSFGKILHSIGDALGILSSATPLIGADANKVNDVIKSVHSLADDVGATIDSVHNATTQGVKVDHSALRTALESLLPALLEEGVSLALSKLLPEHTASVVAAATPEVVGKATPEVVAAAKPQTNASETRS